MKYTPFVFAVLFIFKLSSVVAEHARILTQREQATVIDELLDHRVLNLLPELMRRKGFDMWDILSREYNEDPVIKTLLPATWHAARRTTMLVVCDPGTGKEPEYWAAAGTTIGMWDMQNGVPDTGDYPMHAQRAYSIERNVTTHLDAWKKDIQIMLEEDGFSDAEGRFRYIDGRQKELILIPRISRLNK